VLLACEKEGSLCVERDKEVGGSHTWILNMLSHKEGIISVVSLAIVIHTLIISLFFASCVISAEPLTAFSKV
jgi:hypothetical protein